MAARSRHRRQAKSAVLYAFLIAVSLPIILPYFWLVTIAFSAKTGVAETAVLWRSMAVVVPAAVAVLVGPDLHLGNFIFLWEPDFASVVRSRIGEVKGAVRFPSVWHAFGNS